MTRGNGSKLKCVDLEQAETSFYSEGGETLTQVAHIGEEHPILRNTQGQDGRALTNLVQWKAPLPLAGGQNQVTIEGPFQPKPFFDSVIPDGVQSFTGIKTF